MQIQKKKEKKTLKKAQTGPTVAVEAHSIGDTIYGGGKLERRQNFGSTKIFFLN